MSGMCTGLAILAMGALMVACGSSDILPHEGQKPADPPDQGRPGIASQQPMHGDPHVSVHQPIQVKFSERVRLPESSPVTLRADDVRVPTTASLSPDGTILTIAPTAALAAPANYSVEFGDIRDDAGNPLVHMKWNWKAPLWLSVGQPLQGAGYIYDSTILAGPGEQMTVSSTVDVEDGTERVLLHRVDNSKSMWALLDNRLRIRKQFRPSFILDKELGLLALFRNEDQEILLTRWLGTEWREQGPRIPNAGFSDHPMMKIGKDGERVMAYSVHGEGGTDIIAAHGDNASRLGGPVNGDETERSAILESLSFDGKGTPYVAYSTGSRHGVVRAWSEGSWALVAPPVSSAGERFTLRKITVDDSGNPFALGIVSEGGARYIQILRFDGAHWIACGDRLATAYDVDHSLFAPGRDGHVFAALNIGDAASGTADKLLTFDVTQAGWTAIPPPVDTIPGAMAGAIDPHGAPVIAWKDESSIVHVWRLNR